MANEELIDNLNRALGLELSGVIQYMQHSFLVTGPEREVFREFFRDQSEEARDHAETLGDKVVSLGGVPTVEPGEIRQSTDLGEMLRQDLELERAAMEAYWPPGAPAPTRRSPRASSSKSASRPSRSTSRSSRS